MKLIFALAIISLILSSSLGAARVQDNTIVQIEFTNEQAQFSAQASQQFQNGSIPTGHVVLIDDITRYQAMAGFGAALTESSAYVLKNLPEDAYWKTLHKLFNTSSGIGVSYLRLAISASDFALNDYSYDDMPAGQTDDNLQHFTIERDRKYVLPVLKDILKINPNVRLMMSPWSPPAWMKTIESMKGTVDGKENHLKTQHSQALANFFVKAIQAYEKEGFTIHTFTIQNEPLYGPSGYPGMVMDQYEQTAFINDFLAAAFNKANIKTKLFVYDHNWDRIDYPTYVFQNLKEDSKKIVGGAAVHCYGGGVENQTALHKRFPNMPIYLTECSGGDWNPGWTHNLISDMQSQFIGGINHWSEAVIKWNLALDQDNGPTNGKGGCLTCWGLVKIHTGTHQVTETVNFYTIGLFSKHLPQGSVRIRVTSTDSNLLVTGLVTPNNTRVIYVCNQDGTARTFNLVWGLNFIKVTIPGNTVGVYKWKPS